MSPASPRTVEPSPSGTVIYAATAGLTTGSERLVPLLLVTAGHLISGTLCLAACITTARRVAGGLAGPLAPGGLLAGINPGPDGNMWFAAETANAIGRITSGAVRRLTVTRAGTGSGNVRSSSGLIDCGPTCAAVHGP